MAYSARADVAADATLVWQRAAWGRNPLVNALMNVLGLVAFVIVLALIARRCVHTARETGLLKGAPAPEEKPRKRD